MPHEQPPAEHAPDGRREIKRPYRAPELRDLGRLAELTLANAGAPLINDGVGYHS
jgi:hypothetical protein